MKIDLETLSGATFSACRRWRYTLHRTWAYDDGHLMVVGLNPSTADEFRNDPTVTRCIELAHRLGFGGLIMMNAFAIRGTDPKILKQVDDPVGRFNDFYLTMMADRARMIILAWGNHGLYKGRQEYILKNILTGEVHCLGVTKLGCPRHPLYLKKDVQPVLFEKKFLTST